MAGVMSPGRPPSDNDALMSALGLAVKVYGIKVDNDTQKMVSQAKANERGAAFLKDYEKVPENSPGAVPRTQLPNIMPGNSIQLPEEGSTYRLRSYGEKNNQFQEEDARSLSNQYKELTSKTNETIPFYTAFNKVIEDKDKNNENSRAAVFHAFHILNPGLGVREYEMQLAQTPPGAKSNFDVMYEKIVHGSGTLTDEQTANLSRAIDNSMKGYLESAKNFTDEYKDKASQMGMTSEKINSIVSHRFETLLDQVNNRKPMKAPTKTPSEIVHGLSDAFGVGGGQAQKPKKDTSHMTDNEFINSFIGP